MRYVSFGNEQNLLKDLVVDRYSKALEQTVGELCCIQYILHNRTLNTESVSIQSEYISRN